MSIDKRSGDASRRHKRGGGWTSGDSRDDDRAAGDAEGDMQPPIARPVVDARGKAIITPNGFKLYF